MNRKHICFLCAIQIALTVFSSCGNGEHTADKIDTLDKNMSVKTNRPQTSVDSLLVSFKSDANDVSQFSVTGDTLCLVTDGFYWMYPFGKFKSIETFQKKYPELKFVVDKNGDAEDTSYLYKTSFKNNFLKIFLDKETNAVEIIAAKILTDDIVFAKGERIGMEKTDFLNIFFRKPVVLDEINNIKVIGAVSNTVNLYHFDHNVLSSISIDTDYILPKD